MRASLLQGDLILTHYVCNDPISKCGHTLKYWGLGPQHTFWGDTQRSVTQVCLPTLGRLSQSPSRGWGCPHGSPPAVWAAAQVGPHVKKNCPQTYFEKFQICRKLIRII